MTDRVETPLDVQRVVDTLVRKFWPTQTASYRVEHAPGPLTWKPHVRSQTAVIVTVFAGGPSVLCVLPQSAAWLRGAVETLCRPVMGR